MTLLGLNIGDKPFTPSLFPFFNKNQEGGIYFDTGVSGNVILPKTIGKLKFGVTYIFYRKYFGVLRVNCRFYAQLHQCRTIIVTT